MPLVSEAERAYTAGIIDGEGCIRMQRGTFGLDVSVGNTDLVLLAWLHQRWGGKIYPNRSIKIRNAKPFFHWRVCSKEAFPLLRDVLPFLVVKQDRAAKALELEEFHYKQNNYLPGYNESMRKKRIEIYDSLKAMNRRGLKAVGAE